MGNPFDGFDDIMGGLFGKTEEKKAPVEEKGLPWAAKTIDGKIYVPLEQVVELLSMNKVLPKVRKGLERYLSQKKEA